ncbi:N-acetylglucosamine-6-phosphate deacetylase [Anaerocolumna sp.]|uniref:N-acetylglucosamine-6-phosphate deacetylase n=1 Tax=Anaerocolumna sp. TaxID=2041569 RepID=UPI0028A69F0B|nr:N-acetylglucosamine-6-phosphate deacetylase [Anaerocolumna sp.]
MKRILFKNARIITTTGIKQGELLTAGNIIHKVVYNDAIQEPYDEIIDVEGKYLSPGFIDIHTHGGGGYDFMDGSLEAIYNASKLHMQYGTTSIVPTTITGTHKSLLDFTDLFNQVDLSREGCPNILGLHLEGPYFSYNQRGAQDPKYLRNPDKKEYLEVLAKTNRIIRWSFAVELEGAKEFLRVLREQGIVSSLAHSDATCEEVYESFENGLSALTHFYSAMSTVTRKNSYRVAGAIEAGYLLDELYVEVIADGKHLPKELLQLIYKIKGPDKICLVTDSMRGAGMPDGSYVLGNKDTGLDVIVEDEVAKLPDRSSFAGSVATADRLVRTFYRLTEAPLYQVVKMMTFNPARLLKIDSSKGSIGEGKDADLIIFDENIQVDFVMVKGKINKN